MISTPRASHSCRYTSARSSWRNSVLLASVSAYAHRLLEDPRTRHRPYRSQSLQMRIRPRGPSPSPLSLVVTQLVSAWTWNRNSL